MIDLNKVTSFSFDIEAGTITGQILVWNDTTNGWEAQNSTLNTPENTIIVAKSGGDHATIQDAIDASTSGDAIIVYPGTYSENITLKASSTTNIEGVGNMGSVIVEANSGNVLTIPSDFMTMGFLKNLKLKSTISGSNISKLVYNQGMMVSFLDVVFDYNISNGYTNKIIDLQAGANVFMNCKFDYDGTGTSGGNTNFISANGSAYFNILQGFGDMKTASVAIADHILFTEYNTTGKSVIRDFDCNIVAGTASFAGHLDFIHMITGELEVMSTKIAMNTPSGIAGSYGQVYHLIGTGGAHIHSTSNRIAVVGFEKNYIANINTNELLYSHFDDIVAVDNIIGDGTYSYVNSPSDGDLQMSGDIISKVVNITVDYDSSERWEWGVLNSDATTEITATFNTTEINSLPDGAKRVFTNSSIASNFIINTNGITVGNSTVDRAIYPNGYIKIEKIGGEFIITSSYNTSFNIDLADIPNKTFHLDFSDASSVTQSGDDITSMTESINGWSGDGTALIGRIKYGLTTQNGLNTGLWSSSNSTLNFGNRVLHSNLTGRGLTIISIVKPRYGGDAIISKYADNVPNREWRLLTNSAVIYDELDASGTEAALNFSSNYEEWQIIGMTWEPGGRLAVYKNGYLMGTSSYTTTDIPTGTADLMVGISDLTGMDYVGEMGEIIAISDTPTEDMRQAMVSKLGAKWGIDTAIFSASDSSPFGRNEETSTIKPLLDGDNLDIGTGVLAGVLADGIELETDTAPTTDKMVANKKYVDGISTFLIHSNNGWTGTQSYGNTVSFLGDVELGAGNSDEVTIKGAILDSDDVMGTADKILVSDAFGQVVWEDKASTFFDRVGTVLSPKTAGDNIETTGYISGKKSGVFAYLGTATTTTCTLADTWYSINGTFTNSVIENFSVATVVTPGIKYDGTKTQFFEIDYHATISADENSTTVHLGVKKNGTIDTGSIMGAYSKEDDELKSISGTCVLELSQNDEIQLVVMADDDGDVINIVHYTTTINEFFD